MSNALLEAALNYARAGIPIFPCHPGVKTPATKRGFHDATCDEDTIRAWWTEVPDSNPAFCPQQAGYAVVDLDPGATWTDSTITYSVATPRGGRHLYFAGELPPSQGRLGPHIDTRGVGSYVLIPPSRTEHGVYSVLADVDVAPLPAWVSETLARHVTPMPAVTGELDLAWNVDRARDMLFRRVKEGRVAVEGNSGDNETIVAANAVLDLGVSPERTIELMLELWNPHCTPPWSDEDMAIKVRNAVRSRQNEIGSAAMAEPLAIQYAPEVATYAAPVERSRFYFEDEDEQERGSDPAWLIPEVIPDCQTIMLYGPTGSYKSFLSLDLALCVATGTRIFGHRPVRSGKVFYAAMEGRNQLKKGRRRAWRASREFVGKIDNFFVGPAPRLSMPGEIDQFYAAIRTRCGGEAPALIILDTTAKIMVGLNEDKSQEAGQFVQFCDQLVAFFKCSVIAVHHASDKEGAARQVRGSSAFKAGFDSFIRIDHEKASKLIKVWVEQHKDAEEPEHPWTFEARRIEGSAALYPTTAAQHAVLAGAADAITAKAVGKALHTLGPAAIAPRTVSTHILATVLSPPNAAMTQEEQTAQWIRTEKALKAKSALVLEAYCFPSTAGLQWSLPAGT